MKRSSGWYLRLLLIGSLAFLIWGQVAAGPSTLTPRAYLPLVSKEHPPVEVRALWVSRFEWTSSGNPGSAATIDDIVQKAAGANFNMILFQVRGTADAFYTPGLEPWSARLNSGGVLGQDPGWDPLARMISSAHAAGLQVHAYLNVYPTWYGTEAPLESTTPVHPFWTWSHWPNTDWADWRHWYWDYGLGQLMPMPLNSSYLFASPAAPMVADHVVNVAKDILNRYDVDGLHLDYIRYAGPQYSCDPYTQASTTCFTSGWEDWQRGQISALVQRIYNKMPSDVMLSAAVWPIYVDRWGWGATEGRNDYYQDSQAWAASGIVDALMPMIYPANYDCDDEGFWTQEKWQILAADFQGHRSGRYIVAGIGGGYCTFDEIAWRIEQGRALGTAGHAIFSYSGLNSHGYWDDFVAPGGPHEEPALVPTLPWR
jgi:uncharacterized lipoprotein YddW (UPF0748 family)